MLSLLLVLLLALVLFVVAEAGKGPLATAGGPAPWARPASIVGALLAIVHAVIVPRQLHGQRSAG